MMQWAGDWLKSIVLSSLLVSVITSLVPRGSYRRIAQSAGGLIFILVALGPFGQWDREDITLNMEDYRLEIEERRAEFEEENETAFAQGIAQRTQAYIWDKAQSLHLSLSVQVETSVMENGAVLPNEVYLAGEYSAELENWIEETLGIPKEKQHWSEE